MSSELTNLLPVDRQQWWVRDYRFRLAVVAVSLGVLLIVIAAILLVPTYVFLAGTEKANEAHLMAITSTLSSADDRALSERLSALSNDTNALVALAKNSSVSGIMRAILAVPRPGITLSDFLYTLGTGTSASTLTVSGLAATRDALRSYQLALQGVPFVSAAALPVSVYAKDTNITFTITLTLAP